MAYGVDFGCRKYDCDRCDPFLPARRRNGVLRSDDQPGDVAGAVGAVAIYGKGGFHPVVSIGWAAAFIGVGSVCLIRYPKREKVPRPHFSLDRFILVKALPAALAYILVAIPYGMITSFVVLYGKEIEVADPGYFFIYMAIGVGTSRLISGRLVDHGEDTLGVGLLFGLLAGDVYRVCNRPPVLGFLCLRLDDRYRVWSRGSGFPMPLC